jgi:hypothetical protein
MANGSVSQQKSSVNAKEKFSATHVVASTFGILVGLAGINHGIFEILQGNVAPSSIMIEAIGPEQRFWEYGAETALTIVPSYLFSGLLSVLIGLAVIVWAYAFMDKKYGSGIFMLLSIILFLVGGGFAPIFMAVLASLTATRINQTLKFWGKVLPEFLQRFLANIWLATLIAFVLLFVLSVMIAVFGWPLTIYFDDEQTFGLLNSISYIMVGLMLLSILTGFAYDLQQRD